MKALLRIISFIKRPSSFSLLINVLLICDLATADEILRYNLGTSGSSIPYENAVDENRAGILVEILPLIMDRAGIETEKVMLSTKRAMIAFKTGKLDFDFFSPSWLSDNEPAGDFTFSAPILDITEYFITLPENRSRYPNVASIYGETVGMISGAASRYWSSIHGIDIALGPVHTQGKLALRVHNRHKNKMPAINSAIAYLHQTGQIKQILDKYSDFSL